MCYTRRGQRCENNLGRWVLLLYTRRVVKIIRTVGGQNYMLGVCLILAIREGSRNYMLGTWPIFAIRQLHPLHMGPRCSSAKVSHFPSLVHEQSY